MEEPEQGVARRGLFGLKINVALRRALLLAILAFVMFRYVCRPVYVRGESMAPTYQHGQIRLVNLHKYAWQQPRRGDVVVIGRAGSGAFFLKRVLALPTESIAFQAGDMIIDGSHVPEPYIADKGDWTMPETVLASDEYFVAGDNRQVPIEYHTLGITKLDSIRGGLLY